jgi:hypothetical protein
MTPVDSPQDVAPLHVRVLGVVVRLLAPDAATRDRLAHQWSRAVVDAPEEEPVESITASAGTAGSQAAQDYALTTHVTVTALRATAGRRINLHASGLADEHGRVLALVGRSGTGKTTATRILARHLGYLSDETVSIAPDGVVSPHPKPLSVVVHMDRPFEKDQVSPDDLGLLPTPDKGTLARLVVLHRGPDAPRGLTRLDTAQGLLELIEQSSSLAQVPTPLRVLMALTAACGGVWSLGYDEIGDHVQDLVGLLASQTAATPDPGPAVVWHEGTDDFPLIEGNGDRLARLPWVEAVELDGELLVLNTSRAWLLADLTATVWLLLSEPRTMEELVAAAQEQHGEHPDARSIVEQAVRTLAEETLVARGTLA